MSFARKISNSGGRAFSLVEVTIALGLAVFCLVGLLALLPAGIRSNRESVESSYAANLLTVLEADLRNTHPSVNGGKSLLFGLTLPYAVDADDKTVLNQAVPLNTVSAATSIGLDDEEAAQPFGGASPVRYQASVIYTQVPKPGSEAPVQARLVVNWPAVRASAPRDLIDSSIGHVEVCVTFPHP